MFLLGRKPMRASPIIIVCLSLLLAACAGPGPMPYGAPYGSGPYYGYSSPASGPAAAPMPMGAPMPMAAPMPAGAPGAPMMVPDNSPQFMPSGPYLLDTGDRLRVVVYGQEGLSNVYTVDATGQISMPLIGQVPAAGGAPAALERAIAARLRSGYIKEPHVAVEVETYRPFFIMGEVTLGGQYPYVNNMNVQMAVAIAGGYSPRADRGKVEVTRKINGVLMRAMVPPTHPLFPGDTVVIKERWF